MFYGIDLGTTNSAISYGIQIESKGFFEIQTLTNTNGDLLTPSVVYFEEGSTYSIGENALQNYIHEPNRTIRWVKRKMGLDYKYTIDDIEYSPQSISATILSELKSYAEKGNIDNAIENVVITVPADFDNNAKQATIDAAIIAGFKNVHLIPEPNAAILNYIYKTHEVNKLNDYFSGEDKYILVFDLGGGTFDVSLSAINLIDNGKVSARVITSYGNKYLGGINFDKDLMIYVLNKAIKLNPKDNEPLTLLLKGAMLEDYELIEDESIRSAIARIIMDCEICKKQLCDNKKRTLTFFSHERKTYKVDVSREEFELLLAPYFSQIKANIDNVLTEAIKNTNNKFKAWSDLYGVLMVGGSTRIPAVQSFCENEFNQPIIVDQEIYTSVSRGAAIYASILANESPLVSSYDTVIPHDFGVKLNGEFIPVLQKGTTVKNVDFEYEIPFALDTKAPIEIVQKYYSTKGEETEILIEKINYSHPFMYTGDILEIAFEINDDLILSVSAKESCIEDEVELMVNDFAKLTTEQIQIEQEKIRR
ncbi:Hsp70 family protein [Brevibacillus fluminis]|uniref:Chaperone protein DnaK n=1 Tax=Brevibacillus fluminis TaxID=511487 RepID=A0A3M8DGI4_9BACL|nr:Hsp70 family protein [Brevibacillus fluminis]RNB87212.1 Hsp70 family protein [Brevibacillus fluminis]